MPERRRSRPAGAQTIRKCNIPPSRGCRPGSYLVPRVPVPRVPNELKKLWVGPVRAKQLLGDQSISMQPPLFPRSETLLVEVKNPLVSPLRKTGGSSWICVDWGCRYWRSCPKDILLIDILKILPPPIDAYHAGTTTHSAAHAKLHA